MVDFYMNLSLFEGGAAGAGAAPAAGTGEGTGGEAAVVPGVLEDGTQVDKRLAARMVEQARKRKARGEEPLKQPAQMTQQAPAEEPQQPENAEPSLDDQWTEVRKKFKEQIGRDIKSAVDDRFKNQADLQGQLDSMQPMLQALMTKAGVDNLEDLSRIILDDDELYEEAAEKAGMTVEGYKQFKQLQDEHDRRIAEEEQHQRDEFIQRHFNELVRQGEELKKTYPDFDLIKELENDTFKRLTAPNSGLSVEAAYYAVHHKDLEQQAMAYGIQRTQQQISQTMQANRARPAEGAMKTGGQPADIALDPRNMSREQRQKLIERARRGEKIII